MLLAIDRAGSLAHQSTVMLELLAALLNKQPVQVRIFDTERKTEKYTCSVSYADGVNAKTT